MENVIAHNSFDFVLDARTALHRDTNAPKHCRLLTVWHDAQTDRHTHTHTHTHRDRQTDRGDMTRYSNTDNE